MYTNKYKRRIIFHIILIACINNKYMIIKMLLRNKKVIELVSLELDLI